ncbi:Clavaminate synthase-like protein [Epithele typhae]|uniref:Clavaminate synthase-like protein n=1 Tax=Epithele typhae TaxID=378194 RepID=UPI002008AF4D|nr:Clavaminate synthase-like protein [Epithele typhae]KAH9918580.1 Clavaminate synthase-like protein [Epithele typhae]
MPHATAFPPFPADIPTHPLLVVDYELLKAHDEAEIDKLWKAATELGFWYLKNHGADAAVNAMFDTGAATFALPLADKMAFEQGDSGFSFGYKASGATLTDASGARDTTEFFNVAADDALAWPAVARRTYPAPVNARMGDAVGPFIRRAIEVNGTMLGILNERLGLPRGTLASRHRRDEWSGSEARVTRGPPRELSEGIDEAKAVLAAHTDFGSLSFLHNRLGGLQVMVPGTRTWQYVKPIPGHAICNVGDALTIFSGGLLRSNLHRVVPPPGEQARYERYSLVYFTRPGDSVQMAPLADQSAIIADAVARAPPHLREIFDLAPTSHEWFTRRMKNMRVNNQKGTDGGVWNASRGTEHEPHLA